MKRAEKVREHYDVASPYYLRLWGRHLHHGYWVTGDETRDEATDNLLRLIVASLELAHGACVLDVGCGMGGTAVWLAREHGCEVTGITLSPVQVEMARSHASGIEPEPAFLVMDATDITLTGSFDAIIAIESPSHFESRERFFARLPALLAPGGRVCIADWVKAEGLSDGEMARFIDPIDKGMLVRLDTAASYIAQLEDAGLHMVARADISAQVRKTWDISMKLIADPALWKLALAHGPRFTRFLHAFDAMRRGFASGAFRYEVLTAERRKIGR